MMVTIAVAAVHALDIEEKLIGQRDINVKPWFWPFWQGAIAVD